ncbi:MAG: cytidine deaminase [Verrucomicrobiales bacterium]|nr:cytidine deaminase [Verrucomicrobiales bacterium]|tara:strand:- start:143 stop:553 length:411 start_codon:yes stop_codon:yes gene_type:complete
MDEKKRDRLIEAALDAAERAVAPYSGLHIGAAFETSDGQVIAGANVESASYGLTCCAERVALFKALTDGHRDFTAIALVSPTDPVFKPCGACRQLLAEYAPNAVVWCKSSTVDSPAEEYRLNELLPAALVSLPGSE